MIDGMNDVITRISQIQKKINSIQNKVVDLSSVKQNPTMKTDKADIDNKKISQSEISSIVKKASEKYNVPENLVHSVIKAESDYNQYAVSSKRALGFMQVLPETALSYGYENVFSPSDNINAGTKHLSYLIKKYDGNYEKAVAAYNAGETAVNKYNGIPPYKETTAYVEKVMNYYNKLNGVSE